MEVELKIVFKNFIFLNDIEKKDILELRNKEYVRENMINSEPISLENHILFIESLKENKNKTYFAIFFDDYINSFLNYEIVSFDFKTNLYFFLFYILLSFLAIFNKYAFYLLNFSFVVFNIGFNNSNSFTKCFLVIPFSRTCRTIHCRDSICSWAALRRQNNLSVSH